MKKDGFGRPFFVVVETSLERSLQWKKHPFLVFGFYVSLHPEI